MDHEQIQDKLSLFHDGEVTEPERREVAAHLSRCAECRGRLEQWDRFGSLLSKTAVNYDSEEFLARTMSCLPESEREAVPVYRVSFRLPKWLYPTVGYAFAVMLVFAAIIARQPILNAEVSTESVLLTDVPQDAQWTVSGGTHGIYELYELKEEGL